MKYQFAIFHPGGEHWNIRRDDGVIVSVDTIEEAEREATRLSEMYSDRSVLIITIHACFRTETTYPAPVPIRATTRYDIA